MNILHLADLHWSNKVEKREEVQRCTDSVLASLPEIRPDVAVIAGDTLDEHDGRIHLDSEAARGAIRFVRELAVYCPVLIIRGTPSHDREAPYIFREIRSNYRIYVGTEIEQVALLKSPAIGAWWGRLAEIRNPWELEHIAAVFSLLPSVEKAWLLARGVGSVREINAQARELLFNVFQGFGLVNETLSCPRILVTHGTVTGAQLSSGIETVGEDLEYGLSDLAAARVDLVAAGHIHKEQGWTVPGPDGRPVRIRYAGSIGRMNSGELERKGFVTYRFADTRSATGSMIQEEVFHETPARRYVKVEIPWMAEGGVEAVKAELAVTCQREDLIGAEVRFTFTVPEEHLHEVDPNDVRRALETAGAKEAKVTRTILPKERTRASGIGEVTRLDEKFLRWAATVGVEVAEEVLSLARRVEGMSVEEIAAEVLVLLEDPIPCAAGGVDTVAEARLERVRGAIEGFAAGIEGGITRQPDLFGGAA